MPRLLEIYNDQVQPANASVMAMALDVDLSESNWGIHTPRNLQGSVSENTGKQNRQAQQE